MLGYFYCETISTFYSNNADEIVGKMVQGAGGDINQKTLDSWTEEIDSMQKALTNYFNRGSILMEYVIPRMGRRIDVVTIIDGVVFVWEYKVGSDCFSRDAITQVWDYVLDLKNFHEGSTNRYLVPILVATEAKDEKCRFELNCFDDKTYRPILTNTNHIAECIDKVLKDIKGRDNINNIGDRAWIQGGYAPTPTIVEACVALYNNHSVEEITRHDGEIVETVKTLKEVIQYSKENGHKAICFVTGVPGAGSKLYSRFFEKQQWQPKKCY